jgi:glutamate dehydrogenase/leucine dehydrogenase
MTEKAALAGLAQGGGKAVIIGDPSLVKTPALLRDFAGAVNGLSGRYITAEDVGTTQDDMDLIRETTPFVVGTAKSRGGSGDPSSATAFGVVVAMEAAAAHRWGGDLQGKTVCVVGAGKVGEEVIRLLVRRQAVVIAADVDHDKAEGALRAGAIRLIDPCDALTASADILCPCALGGLLTEDVVPDLRFSMIVGAANNQLARAAVANSLAAAGILYVPDFLANAGGIINIAEEANGYDHERALKSVGQIRDTTIAVLESAEARGITPLAAAEEVVAERLSRARDSVAWAAPPAAE